MRHLGLVIFAGIVAVGGYLAYERLLTPEAKESLKTRVAEGAKVGKRLTATLNPSQGAATEAEACAANQAWVREQWREAGF